MKGSSRMHARRLSQRRSVLAGLGALAVVALVALALVVGGSGDGRDRGTAAQTPAATSSGTPSSSAPAATTAGTTPKATVPTGATDQLPPSFAAVKLDEPAAVGNGITAKVASLTAIRGKGRGPGNIAGPALRATVRIINRTGKPVSLDGVAVDLSYGNDRTPASPLDDPSEAPFHGTLKSGSTAEGTYVFSVPAGQRKVVTLSVGYQAGAPFLVFTGSAR